MYIQQMRKDRPSEQRAIRSERVVLGRDLVVVEVADERHLLQDVLLHARDAVEEEEGEDAGGSTEGGADRAPVGRLEWWIGRVLLLVG